MTPNARKFGVPAPRWTYYRIGTVEGKRVPTKPSHWVYYEKEARGEEVGQKAPMPSPEELPIIGDRAHFPNHELPNPQDIEISFKMFGPAPQASGFPPTGRSAAAPPSAQADTPVTQAAPPTAPPHRPPSTLLPPAASLSTVTPQADPLLPKVSASQIIEDDAPSWGDGRSDAKAPRDAAPCTEAAGTINLDAQINVAGPLSATASLSSHLLTDIPVTSLANTQAGQSTCPPRQPLSTPLPPAGSPPTPTPQADPLLPQVPPSHVIEDELLQVDQSDAGAPRDAASLSLDTPLQAGGAVNLDAETNDAETVQPDQQLVQNISALSFNLDLPQAFDQDQPVLRAAQNCKRRMPSPSRLQLEDVQWKRIRREEPSKLEPSLASGSESRLLVLGSHTVLRPLVPLEVGEPKRKSRRAKGRRRGRRAGGGRNLKLGDKDGQINLDDSEIMMDTDSP
jgi:hypothetical protein